MNPTEPDPTNPSDAIPPRIEGLARGRGTTRGERWFRSLVQNSSDVMMILEADGTVRYVSPAVERVLGYRPEDFVGKLAFDYAHPEDVEYVAKSFAEILQKPGVQPPIEYRVRTAGGFWRCIEVVNSNCLGDPHIAGVVANVRDITERKGAETKLREAEERYRTLVERISAITYVHHREPGKFSGTTYASPQVESVLGYTQEEYTSDPEFWKSILHPEDRERVLATDERTGERGEPFDLEFRMIAKDGRDVWLRESRTLVRAETDGLQVWHGVMFDITELKHIEQARSEAEERYRTLVEQIPAVTYIDRVTDGPDEPLYTSPQIERMLGYSPEKWIEDRLWPECIHPEDRERILAADDRFERERQERFGEEYRLLAKDGSVVWVREEAVLVRDEAGEPIFWQGVIFDLTERKEVEEALRQSEERYRTVVKQAAEGIFLVDIDTKLILDANAAYRDLLGYSAQDMLSLGLTLYDVVAHDRESIDRYVGQILEKRIEFLGERRHRRKDGSLVDVEVSTSVISYGNGEALCVIVHDVTERRVLEDRLRHQAFHDALTDLPNRQLFVDRLGHALARMERRRDRQVAVLFMDLDNFKVVNDSLGHQTGDSLLVLMAMRLKRCLRSEDTLARFGGDEFTVLLEDVEGADVPVRVAERIIEDLRDPFVLEGQEVYARGSIGIAIGEARNKDPDDLLRDADTAMYRAKDEGSGFSVFDPAMGHRAFDRLKAENDLRRAVEQEEFVLHYQPIVSLKTGEIFAVEALVRWEHPERGLLNPDDFVPLAEDSDLVVPMGEQVLRAACLKAKEWQEEHPRIPPLVMSVNLSARQLSRPDLAETIESILKETELEGSCLTLDITETVYVRTLAGNTATLESLRDLEARIFIDDFGVGYSSLAYLKRLPADALKIDRSFVKGLGEDVEDTAIVHMVIELAHTLGLEVIAEGVETEEQVTLLREMGCDMAQGYHFARPLPPEEIPALLTSAPPS